MPDRLPNLDNQRITARPPKTKADIFISAFDNGALERIRTADLTLTKGVLYQLSYKSETLCTICNMERVAGIEPASSAWKAEVLPLNYTRATYSSRLNMVEGEGFEPSKS